ncbi:transglutaminase domain-containing protein [Endozoicomonas sp. SM1973]|uniref:Transglutaminase domain-containing protein n=1 Tax=Spartinivicinus marinus TaxID=2994442 RepID=A0A853I6G1_9GAMM|nr:transglutaminase-like domain-containing protein [Spartinivicinus marinus]MCX4024714.1 transglutaminase-like domain-containing protein [Spartinivicinus marinus]NYZ66258.1 transglutaminase domain-containing protein [Spartinivicinus marinus]
MQKPVIILTSLLILLVVLIGVGYWVINSQPAKSTEQLVNDLKPVAKQVRYSFLVENRSDQYIKSAQFEAFAPVTSTPFQQVIDIKSNYDYQLKQDSIGNQSLVYALADIAPYSQKQITIEVKLDLYERQHQRFLTGLAHSQLTKSSNFIEVNHPTIKQVAARFENKPKQEMPLVITQWLYDNIKAVDYIKEDRGALYALTHLKGDCTEFMYAFIALMRQLESPAIGVAGFIAENKVTVLQPANYHNWTVFKQEDSWQLSDPLNNNLEQAQDYIAFRIMVGDNSPDFLRAQRFYRYDKRLTVTMN